MILWKEQKDFFFAYLENLVAYALLVSMQFLFFMYFYIFLNSVVKKHIALRVKKRAQKEKNNIFLLRCTYRTWKLWNARFKIKCCLFHFFSNYNFCK